MKCSLTYVALFLVFVGCAKRSSDSKSDETEAPAPKLVPLVSQHMRAGHIDFVPFDRIPNLDKYPYREEQLMVPEGTTNIALNKPVSSSCNNPTRGELGMITDGAMMYMRDSQQWHHADVELEAGIQYITIDLNALYSVYAVRFWHCYPMNPVYFDIIVQTANDPEFTRNVHILFNNDHDDSIGLGAGTDNNYIEYPWGKLVHGNGIKVRYIRLYSNGNWAHDRNHYAEVEVYGMPAME